VARGIGTGDDDGIFAVAVAIVLAIRRRYEYCFLRSIEALLVDIVRAVNLGDRCLQGVLRAMGPLGLDVGERHFRMVSPL
jgi:hypothetical protein